MLRLFASSLSMVLAGVGAAFFTHFILAKALPAEQYGIFSFIFSLSLIISIFALFGFQNSAVKFIANFQSEAEESNQTRRFIGFIRLFTLALALAGAVGIYGALYALGFTEKYSAPALMIGTALVPFMVLMRLHAAILRGFGKSTLSVIYETTLREGVFLALIAVTLFIGFRLQLGVEALALFAIALMLATFSSWVHARRVYADAPKTTRADHAQKKEWVQTSFPMMLIIFAQRFLRRSDIIILGLMVHPALVGAYAIVAQFSEVGSIGQKGVFAVFSPRAATLHKDGNILGLKALYSQMQLYGVATTGILCLVIAAAAPYALSYFGEDYTVAARALQILLIGQFANVCFGPVGVLMLMTGHEKTAMKFTLAAALGNIFTNPFAIYYFGLEGAAATTAFFLVGRAAISYYDVKKHKLI